MGDPIPEDLTRSSPSLSLDEFTLPEAFKAANRTHVRAHIGKWHVSRDADQSDDTEPYQHGWPVFIGPDPDLAHVPSYYDWPKTRNGVTTRSTTYATTDQVNEAVRVIRNAKAAAKPYFVWLAFSAPHSPYQKPPNNLHSRDSLPVVSKPDATMRRAYYEAMVEAMDTEIGRLLKEVDLTTTTVIFLGDNGTPKEVTASPYLSSKAKGTPYQGGIRVPLLVAGASVVSPGRIVTRIVNTVDLYPTILALVGVNAADVLPAGTVIDGVSILPYIANNVGTALRTFIYTDAFPDCYDVAYARAVANCCFKLISRPGDSREFYDLRADPYEKKNLLTGTLTSSQKTNLNTLQARLDSLLATAPPPPPACQAG